MHILSFFKRRDRRERKELLGRGEFTEPLLDAKSRVELFTCVISFSPQNDSGGRTCFESDTSMLLDNGGQGLNGGLWPLQPQPSDTVTEPHMLAV